MTQVAQSPNSTTLHSVQHGLNVVEASAGTGKTFHLTFLFVKLYLQQNIELEKLCAITFTNLATAELRERISALFRELRGVLYQQSIRQGEPAIEIPSLAPVISAWLKENFDAVDYPSLIEKCDFALLNLHKAKISTIHGFFQELLKRYYLYASIDAKFNIIESKQWNEITEIWAREFWLTQQNNNNIRAVFYRFFPTPEHLFSNIPNDSSGRAIAIELAEPDWHKGAEIVLKRKSNSKAAEYKKLSSDIKYYIKNQFLRFINKKTESLLQKGYLNFNLILEKTYLASQNNAFCMQVREEVEAILIDEFQDTDYIQWNVIKNIFLSSDSPSSKHIVYLIGDPKQSIYRFRSADIDCYFQAIKQSREKNILALNWRSDKNLLEVLNRIYSTSSLEPTPFEHEDLSYTEVSPPAQKTNKNSLNVEIEDLETKELQDSLYLRVTNSIERVNKESAIGHIKQWIVQDCMQLCNLIKQKKAYLEGDKKKLLEYSDILILCSKNETLALVSNLLQLNSIPVAREIRIKIWQSEAAERVILLLQSLNDASSKHSLSNKETDFIYMLLGFKASLDEKTTANIKDTIYKAFSQWHQILINQGPLYLWQKIGALQCYGEFNVIEGAHKNQLQTITELFEKLQAWWKEGESSITLWLKKIQQQITLEETYSSQENAIRIMTVHRAKGLEAPFVICPDLWIGSGIRQSPFNDYLSYASEKQHYTLRQEPELEAKKIETHRLLYVALTRAKSKLLLYWVPYKHRGEVKSLETLLFDAKLDKGKEQVCIDKLSAISHLSVLKEEDTLLTHAAFNHQSLFQEEREANPQEQIEEHSLTATELEPSAPHSSLWSFTRLANFSLSHSAYHEYEKDQELEALAPEFKTQKTAHNNTVISHISAVQLGTFTHQAIQNILEQNTIKSDELTKFISKECIDQLESLILTDEERTQTHQQLTELVEATLCNTLDNVPLYSAHWHKYSEMRFDLKIQQWHIEKLNEISAKYPHFPLAKLEKLHISNSLFYGFIDLVLSPVSTPSSALSKNIWIVDFKTNFLGERKEDYNIENMHQAMQEHLYGWQALFYAISIHRWFQAMKRSSQTTTHNIQVAYLFSRGLALENNCLSTEEDSLSALNEPQYGRYIMDVPEEMLVEISAILT